MSVVPLPRQRPDAPFSTGTLVGLCAAGCLLALLAGLAPWAVWGGLVGLALLLGCFLAPIHGLAFLIALSALFVRSTEAITPQEIGYGVLFATVMSGWAARRLTTGQPFAATRTDRMLVWFLVICTASVVPAYFYGNALLKWARELVPFLLFLPCLLIPTTLRRASDMRRLCLAFIAASLSMGVINFVEYWLNVASAQHLWELLAGRRTPGEPMFLATLTLSMIMVAFEGFQGWRTLGYLSLVLFSGAALAITFSRGYWVAALIALAVAFLLMPSRRRWVILKYGAAFGVLAAVAATLLMGSLAADIAVVVTERFGTILSTTLDLSLRNRLAETAAVLDRISENPVLGYGLGYYYYFKPLIPYEVPTWYVHNAYLYLWLKVGFLGLAVFLTWYATVLIHGYRAYNSTTDPFLQPLLLGIVSIMIAMVPLSVTSPQFTQKDSILFLALGAGVIEYVYRNIASSGRRRRP